MNGLEQQARDFTRMEYRVLEYLLENQVAVTCPEHTMVTVYDRADDEGWSTGLRSHFFCAGAHLYIDGIIV